MLYVFGEDTERLFRKSGWQMPTSTSDVLQKLNKEGGILMQWLRCLTPRETYLLFYLLFVAPPLHIGIELYVFDLKHNVKWSHKDAQNAIANVCPNVCPSSVLFAYGPDIKRPLVPDDYFKLQGYDMEELGLNIEACADFPQRACGPAKRARTSGQGWEWRDLRALAGQAYETSSMLVATSCVLGHAHHGSL